jgi:hypothetical protein
MAAEQFVSLAREFWLWWLKRHSYNVDLKGCSLVICGIYKYKSGANLNNPRMKSCYNAFLGFSRSPYNNHCFLGLKGRDSIELSPGGSTQKHQRLKVKTIIEEQSFHYSNAKNTLNENFNVS